MRSILIAPFLILAFLSHVAAQDDGPPQQASQRPELTSQQHAAKEELNEAARFYRDGNFVTAQWHSEKALSLDPSSKTALLFVARTIHAQYKPGDQSEANIGKAHEAIASYQRIILQDPTNEEAYRAIAYLYSALKDAESRYQWVLQRALDQNIVAVKRSEAYTVLASIDWDCSFRITELPTNKTTTILKHGASVQFLKPTDQAEFDKAQQCATEGLEFIEAAITLNPESESAWSYKVSLLIEMSKLAEMDHKLELKTEYERQMRAAYSKIDEVKAANANRSPTKP